MSGSYLDPDQILDEGPTDCLYERGWLPDAEDREEYRPGGFHPVHIGDCFGTSNRFRVIHKLGRGGLATVWLCRDEEAQTYVALKIVCADASDEESPELRIVNHKSLDFGEPGGEYIAVPREYFWHDGPNGRHLCLVLPVLGPRVPALWEVFQDCEKVSRECALQLTQGLGFLHRNGICHGGWSLVIHELAPADTLLDFRPSNILFRLTNLDGLSENDLMKHLGEPKKDPLVTFSGKSPGPSGPDYIVDALSMVQLDSHFISSQISIIDFGESYQVQSPPADLGITAAFRPPELFFDNAISIACDLWALACTIYQVRTRNSLFEDFMGDDDEVIMQMIPLLGKLPEPWWGSWKAQEQWFKEDGTPLLDPDTRKPYMMTETLYEFLTTSEIGYTLEDAESRALDGLLKGLLKYEPKERSSVDTVLNHPWFKNRGSY